MGLVPVLILHPPSPLNSFFPLSMSPCPHPDVCGSCGWSHIPYQKQLQQKLSDINGSFKIKNLDLRIEEIIASPKTTHYRNRMDFVIDWQGSVGLREKGKWWRVIDDHTCFLADERIEELFHIVRDWTKTAGLSFYDRKANVGCLRYAVIRSTTLGQAIITIVTSTPTDDSEKRKIEMALENLTELTQKSSRPLLASGSVHPTILWTVNHTASDVSYGDEMHVIFGDGCIEENISGYRYRISPNAFFQTNPHAASALLDTVREFVGDLSDKTLLDLYCGTGFFSIALAKDAKRTIGIELVADAIKDAHVNAELNNLQDTIEYLASPTENIDWLAYNADIAIIDPPRAGLHPTTLDDLMKPNAPKEIVYVSCNYKNLARELVILSKSYEVESIRAIDMFPHTPHVEVVTKLIHR